MLICYNNEVTINSLRWMMMTSTAFFSTHQKRDDIYHLYYEYDLFVSV